MTSPFIASATMVPHPSPQRFPAFVVAVFQTAAAGPKGRPAVALLWFAFTRS
jgi:hypothetical protein